MLANAFTSLNKYNLMLFSVFTWADKTFITDKASL